VANDDAECSAQMMNMDTVQNSKLPSLVRGLGLWSAIAVVVGSMIGQAVFLVGSDMAQELGSVTKLLAAWLSAGSWCSSELVVMPSLEQPCRKQAVTMCT
jgi:hypothetical protein